MGTPYENLGSGNEMAPVAAGADIAEEAQAEIQPAETAEPQAETGAEAGAVEFGPETIDQTEAAIRKKIEGGDMTPEDRERGEMVADETREIGGILSRFTKTPAGRAVSRVLAGGMIALSLAAAMPKTVEAGGRSHSRGGASVAEIATAGAVFAGLSVLLGGSRASQEAVRAQERITLEQIRTQRQLESERIRLEQERIRADARIRAEEIRADKEIRKEEIRKGIIRQPEAPPQQGQVPNIPPPPPPPTPERQPPTPTIDE